MNISTLISHLEKLKEDKGDLEVGIRGYENDKFIEIDYSRLVMVTRKFNTINESLDDASLGEFFIGIR